MSDQRELAARFEANRDYLRSVAYRWVRDADASEVSDSDARAGHLAVDAFFAAARDGNFDALVRLLDPNVNLRVEGPGTTDLIQGAEAVAQRALLFARPDARLHPARMGDAVGVVITVDGRPISMMAFTLIAGVVSDIHTVIDPARLARLVPSWVR